MRFYFLFVLFAFSCVTPQKITDYKGTSVAVTEEVEDGGLDSLINPYREALNEEMNEVIGTASTTLEKFTPESPLSNFSADAVYNAGAAYGERAKDIGAEGMSRSMCLLNFGGLRAPINQGNVTVGNIYELMPFDNTLVLVELNGEQMKTLVTYLFEEGGQPIANAQMRLSKNVQEVTIGGEPYNFDSNVMVITSNYLADGGDKMNFFKDPIRRFESGIFLRDIFINSVRTEKQLGPYHPDGRIQFLKE